MALYFRNQADYEKWRRRRRVKYKRRSQTTVEWTPELGLDSGSSIWGWWDLNDTSTVFQSSVLSGGAPVTGTPSTSTDPVGTVVDQSGNGRTLISGADAQRPTYVSVDGVMAADLGATVGRLFPADGGTVDGADMTAAAQVIAFSWRAPASLPATTKYLLGKNSDSTLRTVNPSNLVKYGLEEAATTEDLNDVFTIPSEWYTYILKYVSASELEIWVGTPSLEPSLVATVDPDDDYSGAAAWAFNQLSEASTGGGVGGYLLRAIAVNDGTVNATDIVNIHKWLVRPLLAIGRDEMQALPSVAFYLPIDSQDISNKTITEVVSGTDLVAAANYPPMVKPTSWETRGTIPGSMIWEDNHLRWKDEIDVVFQTSQENWGIDLDNSHMSLAVYSDLVQPGYFERNKGALLHSHIWAKSGLTKSEAHHNTQTTRGWDSIINVSGSAGETGSTEAISEPGVSVEICTYNSPLSGDDPAVYAATAGAVVRSPLGNEKYSLGYSEEPARTTTGLNAYNCKQLNVNTTAGDVTTSIDIQSGDHWDLLTADGHPDANPPVTPFQQITFGGQELQNGQNMHFHGYIIIVSEDEIDETRASRILKFCAEQWTYGTDKALPKYLMHDLAGPAQPYSYDTTLTDTANDGDYQLIGTNFRTTNLNIFAQDYGGYGDIWGFACFPSVDAANGLVLSSATLEIYLNNWTGNPANTWEVYVEQALATSSRFSDTAGRRPDGTLVDVPSSPVTVSATTGLKTIDLTTQINELLSQANWASGDWINLYFYTTSSYNTARLSAVGHGTDPAPRLILAE